MSAVATGWALEQTTGSPTRKLILLVLADVSGRDGMSWFSQRSLAVLSEASTRTVRNALAALEEEGLLHRFPWYREDHSRDTDLYLLPVPGSPPPEVIASGEYETRRGVVPAESGEVRQLPPDYKEENQLVEPEIEPEVVSSDLFTQDADLQLATAIGQFCIRMRVKWKLSVAIDHWAREVRRDPRYVGIDFVQQTHECAEYHEGTGKKMKSPDRSLRTWYRNARKFSIEPGGSESGTMDVDTAMSEGARIRAGLDL